MSEQERYSRRAAAKVGLEMLLTWPQADEITRDVARLALRMMRDMERTMSDMGAELERRKDEAGRSHDDHDPPTTAPPRQGEPNIAISAVEYNEVHKLVCGALKCCIDAHGPIEYMDVGSAAKRVVKSLIGRSTQETDG